MQAHEVTRLAKELMEEHNLDWPLWGFRLTRTKLHIGQCRYTKFNGGEISFSKAYLHLPYNEIRDTILHEIAHAIAGHAAGHGPKWKRVCREIGATPNPKADLSKELQPAWKWTGVCPNNPRHTLQRHALTERGKGLACSACCKTENGGVWTSKFLFEWHLTDDLKAAGRSGAKLITQLESTSLKPTRISELMSAGF